MKLWDRKNIIIYISINIFTRMCIGYIDNMSYMHIYVKLNLTILAMICVYMFMNIYHHLIAH